MTCNILTPGHIMCIEYLTTFGDVIVGLLTKKALTGYKHEAVPYRDRKFLLETVAIAIGNVKVVPQDSLDPTENIKKYRVDAIASGDGWEKTEEKAIEKFKLQKIDIKLPGETTKMYSSSKVLKTSMV